MVESNTKIKLLVDEVHSVVEQCLGLGAQVQNITVLEDGWFNAAWRIDLSPGYDDLVLKVGPPDSADILTYEQGIMRAEIEAMTLAAQDARIPVPEIIFHDYSRTVLGSDFFFVAFVPGDTWQDRHSDLSAEAHAALERQLGTILAAVNSFKGQKFGYWACEKKFDRWYDCFENMLSILFEDAGHYAIDLRVTKSDVLALLARNREAFDEVEQPQLVHWDLWPGNIIIEGDGAKAKITGVLDFERAFWGDPVAEYSFGQGDRESLNQGYGQDLLAGAGARKRRVFYDLYLHLVMVIEDGPRDYADKGIVNWARAQLVLDVDKLRG